MKQLMIVEDDGALASGLALALQSGQAQSVLCANLKAAREQLSVCTPDLILLDVNLPDGSGLDFLRETKAAHPGVPVILLTANDTEVDIVSGLGVGADDYITKPFSLAVLRARVEACLRRGAPGGGPQERVMTDGYSFDFARMEFYRRGEAVELSKTEQKLLRLLVENRGVTLARATLVDRIWTDGAEYVDENALSVTVKRLRDKLHAGGIIKTVYGIGYVWAVK